MLIFYHYFQDHSLRDLQTQAELSKFDNFQSLLGNLVNEFKALNFLHGIQKKELEVFLNHQLKINLLRIKQKHTKILLTEGVSSKKQKKSSKFH